MPLTVDDFLKRSISSRGDGREWKIHEVLPEGAMNRRTAALRSAVVLLALAIFTGDLAGQSSTRFNPPKRYYLALGDSLAFGFQFVTFNANVPSVPASLFSTGYVDDLAGMLQEIRPRLTTLNYGCPAETSFTFIQGGCTYTAAGFPLHDPYDGSQLSAALAVLHAHRGQVSPITINIGVNDLIGLRTLCGDDVSCYFANGPAVLDGIAANLQYILSQLRAAAPDAEIITFTNYDVAFLFDARLLQLTQAFNSVVISTAAPSSVRVADVFGAFNGGPQPATLCALTFVCTPLQDSHPSDLGYEVIARQIWAASDYDRLRPEGDNQF
jgi:lysophospholipase L1-like esterase